MMPVIQGKIGEERGRPGVNWQAKPKRDKGRV